MLGEKLNAGKYLLWFAEKEGYFYKKLREGGKRGCEDGIWLGRGRHAKTFYKHHSLGEVDGVALSAGLVRSRGNTVTGCILNDAALYEKR